MFICPRCDDRLDRTTLSRRVCWVCPTCEGDAIALPVLRDEVTPAFSKSLWRAAYEMRDGCADGLPCPICRKGMPEVPLEVDDGTLLLDVCTRCHFVWLDTGEFERTPAPEPPPPEKEIPAEAREAMAIAEVEMRNRLRQERELGSDLPRDPAQLVAGVLGLPVEHHAPALHRRPLVTWTLTALFVVVAAVGAALGQDHFIRQWALVPAHALRIGGLTLLTSFFLHAGVAHLLSNGYFLLVFGDNVEDLLGRRTYLLLVAAAALAGNLAHIALDPGSEVPLVGASGGISAVIAFYALRFPEARIGLLFRSVGYFRMGARAAFALWMLMQLGLALLQVLDATAVSAAAHLGGALTGFGFWLWLRPPGGYGESMAPGRRAH